MGQKNNKIIYIIGMIICILIFISALRLEGNNIAPLIGMPALGGIIYFAHKIDKVSKSKNNVSNNEELINNSFNHTNFVFSKSEFDNMKKTLTRNWNSTNNGNNTIPSDNDVLWGLIQKKKLSSNSLEQLEYYQKLEEEILNAKNINTQNIDAFAYYDKHSSEQNNAQQLNKNPIASLNPSVSMEFKITTEYSQNASSVFSEKYLNTKLNDGLTIKHHMKNDYNKALLHSNSGLQHYFANNILQEQYDFIINNIDDRSTNNYDINKYEEIFIKEFLNQISTVRKKYWVTLTRYSDGGLMFYYKGYIVGRINLRNIQEIYMQILTPSGAKHKYFSNFDDALNCIKKWRNYVKYSLTN